MSKPKVKTPCVGRCSTVFGDLICRGCKRFHHEIVHWNRYDDKARLAVLHRLEILLEQVMRAKLRVFDARLLREQLELRKIRYISEQTVYCWAYQLIAQGSRHIKRLEAYGIELLPQCANTPLPALRDEIDADFFALSSAHYERYIVPVFAV